MTSPPAEWGWGLGAPPALLMARGQTFASWYSQNQTGSVPGLLGLELRKVAGLPAPRAHDNMPGGARGPAWGEGTALSGCRLSGSACVPLLQPRQEAGDRAWEGGPPGMGLNWGEHACAQHPRASFGRTVSHHWWPERGSFKDSSGGGGWAAGLHIWPGGGAGGRERAERIGTAPRLWNRHAEGRAWGRVGAGLREAAYREGRARDRGAPRPEPAALGGARWGLGARRPAQWAGPRGSEPALSHGLGRLLGGEEAVGVLDVGEHTPPPLRPGLGGGGQAWLRAP